MKRFSQSLLILGCLAWGGAAVYWRAATQAAQKERSQQVRVGRIALRLAQPGEWAGTTFIPRRAGLHVMVLESVDPIGPMTEALFQGAVEVEIADPHGRLAFQKRVDRASIQHGVPSGVEFSALGDVDVPVADGGAWALRVRVAEGDPQFARAASSIYLQTPPQFDVGWFLFNRFFGVVALAVLGVLLVVIGGIMGVVTGRRPRAAR